MLILKSFATKVHDRSIVPGPLDNPFLPQQHKPSFTFITRLGFHALILAHMLDSLVRVSRRANRSISSKSRTAVSYQQTSIAQWLNRRHSKLSKQSTKTRQHWYTQKHIVGTSVSTTATNTRYNTKPKSTTYLLSDHLPQHTNWLWRPPITGHQQHHAQQSTEHQAASTQSTRTTANEICPDTHTGYDSLPFQQFQVLFNSLFKVLFIFPSRYLFAIGLAPIFSFRWNLPPT